jgi:hypothetical protein
MSSTTSETCKINNEKKEERKDRFNFWIYLSLIILAILLISIFIYSIVKLLYSGNNSTNTNKTFNNYTLETQRANPPLQPTIPIIKPVQPVIKPQSSFISSIFPKASSTTTLINTTNTFKTPEIKKEVNSIISPLFSRQLSPPIINKQIGGYRKLFKRF